MWKQFKMENSEKLIDTYAIGGVGTEKSVPIVKIEFIEIIQYNIDKIYRKRGQYVGCFKEEVRYK